MDISPFDLFYVFIGEEELGARPIEFENGEDGLPEFPIKFHLTCPSCIQLVVLERHEIFEVGDRYVCCCVNCGAGSENIPANLTDTDDNFEDIGEELKEILDESPFLDISNFNSEDLYE